MTDKEIWSFVSACIFGGILGIAAGEYLKKTKHKMDVEE